MLQPYLKISDAKPHQEDSLEDNNILKLKVDINGQNYMDTLNGNWLMLENAKVSYSGPYGPTAKVSDTYLKINYVAASSDKALSISVDT